MKRIPLVLVLAAASILATTLVSCRLVDDSADSATGIVRIHPQSDTSVAWMDSVLSFAWNVQDADGLDSVKIDGMAVDPDAQGRVTKSVALPVGSKCVLVEARDAEGHAASDSVCITRRARPALSLIEVAGKALGYPVAGDGSEFADTVSATDSSVVVKLALEASGLLATIQGSPVSADGSRSILLGAAGSTTTVRIAVRTSAGDSAIYRLHILRPVAPPRGIPWNAAIEYGVVHDSRDGKAYRTVRIGNQTWMAENLDFRGNSGSPDSAGRCFADIADSCAKYGRIYTWSEAMAGSSASDWIPSGRQGICPEGWHVPSDGEWSLLEAAVGGGEVAQALKSQAGWPMGENGTDAVGFRVLPAGQSVYGAYDKNQSAFWSTSGYGPPGGAFVGAWGRYILPGDQALHRDPMVFTGGHSVRCVEGLVDASTALRSLVVDSGVLSPTFNPTVLRYVDSVSSTLRVLSVRIETESANARAVVDGRVLPSGQTIALDVSKDTTLRIVVSNPLSQDSSIYAIRVVHRALEIPWNPAIAYDTLADARDGRSYRTVRIGGQTWMAENLAFAGNGTIGVCYGNSTDSCARYGRLYTWSEVLAGATASSAVPSGVRGICPERWHVPSDGEWSLLEATVGGGEVAQALKAQAGWPAGQNGTDAVGFRMLPGGRSVYGSYDKDQSGFWSSSGYGPPGGAIAGAWGRYVVSGDANLHRDPFVPTSGHSLRCVSDSL